MTTPQTPIEPRRSSGLSAGALLAILIVLCAAGGGAAYYFFKVRPATTSSGEATPTPAPAATVAVQATAAAVAINTTTPAAAASDADAWGISPRVFGSIFGGSSTSTVSNTNGMDDFGLPPEMNDSNSQNPGSPANWPNVDLGNADNTNTNDQELADTSSDQDPTDQSDNQGLTNSNIFKGADTDSNVNNDVDASDSDASTDEGTVDNGTVSANVIKLSGFPEISADYVDDSSQYESELKRSRLKQSELDRLKDLDLTSSIPSPEQKQLLVRLLQLGYYAAKLGKTQALDALLAKVHPSIARAMRLTLVEFVNANAIAAANSAAPEAIDAKAENEKARQAANKGDFASARDIWLRLAQVGNAEAQASLGLMFARGDGVDRDYGEAYKWFSQAGEKGDSRALFAMGKMHFYGDGVTRDKQRAREYIERAAENGNTEAKAFLKKLN